MGPSTEYELGEGRTRLLEFFTKCGKVVELDDGEGRDITRKDLSRHGIYLLDKHGERRYFHLDVYI